MTASRNRKSRRSAVDEFIDIIIEQKERQGMTYTELARRAGVGLPYLHRVLAKEQTPSFRWAEKVAAVLGVEISFHKA